MSVKIIQERLKQYAIQSEQDEVNALKEIFQEIALAALSRSHFFKYAAFQGGTCLRIFHDMQRFSEDLDFVLQEKDDFEWTTFLNNMTEEFITYGIDVRVEDRSKADTSVQKVFLKENSIGQILSFPREMLARKIKIKLEIDVNPPQGSDYEVKYLDFPYAFSVTLQDLPSLFASKSHALLCREYVKGRDWYDFVWYVGRQVMPNFKLLQSALNQMGPWKGQNLYIDRKWYLQNMHKRIQNIDWEEARIDVERFLKHHEKESLKVWSREFFEECLRKLESNV